MKRICIFCGAGDGVNPLYRELARRLGNEMAKKKLGLVYGGASIGIMGTVADGVREFHGEVIGVIPTKLIELEVAHKGITKLYEVSNMHERKEKMYDFSDAFLALPGGFGTLDELCEIVTWAQLKYHHKPIYVLNINGFFDPFLEQVRKCVEEGFIKPQHAELLKVVATIDEALEKLDK